MEVAGSFRLGDTDESVQVHKFRIVLTLKLRLFFKGVKK
jgi:hypothetical protein